MPTQYNPNREAQFAQLLAQGQAGFNNDWGQAIGNLARVLSGTIGLKRQGKAREAQQQQMMEQQQAAEQEEASRLAQILSGYGGGAPVDPEFAPLIIDNPAFTKEFLDRTRPQAPQAPADRKTAKDAAGRLRYLDTGELAFPDAQVPEPEAKTAKGRDGFLYYTTGPNAGKRVLPDVEAPETQRRIIQGADGYQYYEDTGERVLPDVEAPQADATGTITPFNMFDPETRERVTVTTQQELDQLASEGWVRGDPPSEDIRKVGPEAVKIRAAAKQVDNLGKQLIDRIEQGYSPNAAGTGDQHRELKRLADGMILNMATALGRGANLTRDEIDRMMGSVFGGNITSVVDWARMGSREQIVDRLKNAMASANQYALDVAAGGAAEPAQPAQSAAQDASALSDDEIKRQLGL